MIDTSRKIIKKIKTFPSSPQKKNIIYYNNFTTNITINTKISSPFQYISEQYIHLQQHILSKLETTMNGKIKVCYDVANSSLHIKTAIV